MHAKHVLEAALVPAGGENTVLCFGLSDLRRYTLSRRWEEIEVHQVTAISDDACLFLEQLLNTTNSANVKIYSNYSDTK